MAVTLGVKKETCIIALKLDIFYWKCACILIGLIIFGLHSHAQSETRTPVGVVSTFDELWNPLADDLGKEPDA
ncbi:hypothetical protein OAM01_02740 [bacterium]|nr:hypothetical protein [bacterium]